MSEGSIFPSESELGVSRETMDRLIVFVDLLVHWNRRINLVSKHSIAEVWARHIQDSIQVYMAKGQLEGPWLDIGTGGGFPGLVCAILAREACPATPFSFVESDQRKAVFLKTASQTLDLNVTVHAARIEAIKRQAAKVISARALAPLEHLLAHCERHLAKDGCALFLKGRQIGQEIDDARSRWSFKMDRIQSITDPDSSLLRIESIARV